MKHNTIHADPYQPSPVYQPNFSRVIQQRIYFLKVAVRPFFA